MAQNPLKCVSENKLSKITEQVGNEVNYQSKSDLRLLKPSDNALNPGTKLTDLESMQPLPYTTFSNRKLLNIEEKPALQVKPRYEMY